MRLLLVSLILLGGCAQQVPEGPARFSLSGEVLVNGQPVPAGTIHFEPDSTAGNSGPMAIAEITNGRYQTKSGEGVVGGPQKIMVEAFDGKAEPGTPITQGRPLKGSPYRTKADLPKENGTYDVTIDS